MAIALVQSKAANSSTGTTASATFDAAPTPGNLLVYAVRVGKLFSALTLPSGFTDAVHADDDAGAFGVSIGQKANIASGHTSTISVTWTGSIGWDIVIYEFSGAQAVSPVDKTNSNDPSSTSQTSITTGSTGTLSQADEVAVALAGQSAANGSSETIDSGFTKINGTARAVSGYKVVSATTALNPTLGWATARGAVACIATFKAAQLASDSVTSSDAAAKTTGKTAADTATASEASTRTAGKAATDSVTASEASTRAAGKAASDSATASDASVRSATAAKADTATASDAIAVTLSKAFSDSATPSDTATRAVGRVTADSVTSSDAASRALAKALTDAATPSDVAASVRAFVRAFTDTATATDAATPAHVVVNPITPHVGARATGTATRPSTRGRAQRLALAGSTSRLALAGRAGVTPDFDSIDVIDGNEVAYSYLVDGNDDGSEVDGGP